MKKPKILLLFSGGTIAMKKDTKINALVPAKTPEDLLSLAPELNDYFNIDFEFVENLDSTNIQPKHWTKLSSIVYKRYNHYDGFVITHGTDTMSYTASALSFSLQNLGKPVVITGSQLAPDHIGSDARNNLVNAFRVATADLGEVVIAFNNKIIRGNRSAKRSESDLDAFWSPLYPVLGYISGQIDLYGFHNKRNLRIHPILKNEFEENIFVITVVPGIKAEIFDLLMKNDIKGYIIAGFGAGNIPNKENSFIPYIAKVFRMGIPVIVTSQCVAGTSNMDIYQTGVAALEVGGIAAGDMTLEAATTKLMWALPQSKKLEDLRKIMRNNLAGEIKPRS